MSTRSASSYLLLGLGLGVLTISTLGCRRGSSQGPATGYQPGPGQPPPGAAPANPETYTPAQPVQVGSALLVLPGTAIRQLIEFEIIEGLAIYEGDIILGPVESLGLLYGMPGLGAGNVKGATTLSSKTRLWPGGQIPYEIHSSVSPQKREYINWSIGRVNQTELQVRPRTSTDSDYVIFRQDGSGCSSYLGRSGGAQPIIVNGCGKGSVIHEILHASGFYHEQSRGDRDSYVTIVWDEIVTSQQRNFKKRDGRGQDVGAYDYSSVMHYGGRAFSKRGKPTIVPKIAGTPIGQREGLSAGDKAAVTRLYGAGGGGPPTPPPGTKPPAPGPAPANGSFAGNYTSDFGNVACNQKGSNVSCRYPKGQMACTARGAALSCAWWSAEGRGRADFTRQAGGAVAGTWGNLFSATDGGKWTLVPVGTTPPPTGTTPPPTGTTPPPPTTPPPAAASLAGNYNSTRGAMACSDNGTAVSCNFSGSGSSGRLDCRKDSSGLNLSCNWVTFAPPGAGRATFTRKTAADRNLTGTWGSFMSSTDGGKWDAQAK